jgi:hypothetical protein
VLRIRNDGSDAVIYQAERVGWDHVFLGENDLELLRINPGAGTSIADGSLTVGGGYSSTGTTISDAGVLQTDGAITTGVSVTAGSSFIIGGADLNETDLEKLDGITNGTAAANKALVVDASLDIGTVRNLTASGAITSGTFVIGSADINEVELEILDGALVNTAELNIIDGNTSATGTTLEDADRVVVNDAGTMKQIAMTDFNTFFGVGAGATAITNLDIDGATGIEADLATGDLFIVDDGAGGTNKKTTVDRIKTYAGFSVSDITGATALGEEPADTDEFIISDAGTLKRVDYSHIRSGMSLLAKAEFGSATGSSTIDIQDFVTSSFKKSKMSIYVI